MSEKPNDRMAKHGPSAVFLAGTIGSILVRHGLVDAAAIEDPEGYDGGQTIQRVMEATIEIANQAIEFNKFQTQ